MMVCSSTIAKFQSTLHSKIGLGALLSVCLFPDQLFWLAKERIKCFCLGKGECWGVAWKPARRSPVTVLRVCYLENHKLLDIDRKFVVCMKYVLFRYAAHMRKEERLTTQYRKVTAYRSTHAKEPISLQKASELAQSHVTVS
jgi:hypothetical protein